MTIAEALLVNGFVFGVASVFTWLVVIEVTSDAAEIVAQITAALFALASVACFIALPWTAI